MEGEGYNVIESGSALEAVAVLASHSDIDVVFTDINMPGLSGIELAKLVGRNYPSIGIASGRYSIPTADFPSGVRFLPKPYSIEHLARAVGELLDTLPSNGMAVDSLEPEADPIFARAVARP